MAGEADAPEGYVRPKVLTEEEHDEYVHPCGLSLPIDCIGCPVVSRIACLKDHTTTTSLNLFPDSMSQDERLMLYWKSIPALFVEEFSEKNNTFIV